MVVFRTQKIPKVKQGQKISVRPFRYKLGQNIRMLLFVWLSIRIPKLPVCPWPVCVMSVGVIILQNSNPKVIKRGWINWKHGWFFYLIGDVMARKTHQRLLTLRRKKKSSSQLMNPNRNGEILLPSIRVVWKKSFKFHSMNMKYSLLD